MSVNTETHWKCKPCSKTFKTLESLDEHKRSKKHKKSEKEYLKKYPEESDTSMFRSITHEASNILSDLSKSMISNDVKHVEEDTEEAKNRLPEKTSLDSLRVCLFCNEEKDGVKKCLDHMRIKHNFYILDIECLVNLRGLLAYIAERIQLGHMCLLCNK
eukprot:CAMPEP_0176380550 /NCGR_PEP_ID=MMETSP0126-20121128/31216_1 /TAXON_ID=141414 ORGANISM="Strombidinopsis acuminatum, Strain SPMC142" /NCGR_SAMPLE_ID=MMETSP0126 /ASSEMBLY_ACC=CAM_ASM_000229 /LENGTH=158 /DNA_ID=CAMNT_0017743931 /DNA_START=210 /DNA_END=686 /DNA_ORIENTATION=+